MRDKYVNKYVCSNQETYTHKNWSAVAIYERRC